MQSWELDRHERDDHVVGSLRGWWIPGEKSHEQRSVEEIGEGDERARRGGQGKKQEGGDKLCDMVNARWSDGERVRCPELTCVPWE
jgi:hypothetical protein